MGELLKEGTRVEHRIRGPGAIKITHRHASGGGFYILLLDDGTEHIAHPAYVTPLEEPDTWAEEQWT